VTPPKAPKPKLTLTERRAFRKLVDVQDPNGGKPTQIESWRLIACHLCGGVHERACPKPRHIWFGPGESVTEVEYFAKGEWSEDDIIWPEDILAEDPSDQTHVLVAKKDLRAVMDALDEMTPEVARMPALKRTVARLGKLAREGPPDEPVEVEVVEAPRDGIRS
jgi:hypothetical protein